MDCNLEYLINKRLAEEDGIEDWVRIILRALTVAVSGFWAQPTRRCRIDVGTLMYTVHVYVCSCTSLVKQTQTQQFIYISLCRATIKSYKCAHQTNSPFMSLLVSSLVSNSPVFHSSPLN